jgi:hypothetical protein
MVYTGHHRGRRGGHSLDDSVGNRKRPEDTGRNLPEDVGNRKSAEEMRNDTPDDLGNRLGGPAPWSRTLMRGKGPKGRGGKRGGGGAAYKDMESLYAAQGEGVPRMFRPGYRTLPTGELAQVQDGGLKPLGLHAVTGERVGEGPEHDERDHHQPSHNGGGNGAPGAQFDDAGVDGDGRRKRRRRRKRGRGDGMEGVPGGAPQGQAGGAPQQGHGGHHGHQHQQQHQHGGGFEEEDDGFRYQLKSDPEDKRKAALAATLEILKHAGRSGDVTAKVVQETHGPRVVVEIADKGTDGPLFARSSAALSALTFLVNKIINRYPDDRIRLSIVEMGTWVAQVVAPVAPAAAVPTVAVAAPAAAPAVAPVVPAPAPAPVAAPVVQAAADEDEDEEDEDEDDEGEEDAEGEEGASTEESAAKPKPARRAATAGKTTTRRTAAKKSTTSGVRKKAAPKRK